MVMGRERAPYSETIKQLETVKEMIRSDKRENFITMMKFKNRALAVAFCQCLDKCIEDNLEDDLTYIWNLGMSMVAENGDRANKFGQVISGLLVPETWGGKTTASGSNKPVEVNK